MDKLDVLYTVNHNYLDIMLASIYSLILNSNISKIRLHIIEDGFTKEDYAKIEECLKDFTLVEYYFYDIKNFDINKYQIPNWRGSQIANARLFFQSYLQNNLSDIENLLYLDGDTLVIDDLNDLGKYTNNVVGAVKENVPINYYHRLGNNLNFYCNSGVILFNVPKWLEGNFEDKLIHFISEEPVKLIYPDQDIFNVCFQNDITLLPKEYNMQTIDFQFQFMGDVLYFSSPLIDGNLKEIKNAKENVKIIHSTGYGDIKPWHHNLSHPFNEVYREYLLMANPDIELKDLSKYQEFIDTYPLLYNSSIVFFSYLPMKCKEKAKYLVRQFKSHCK